jgi:hypothetical protein
MRERLALVRQSRVLSPQQELHETFLAQALPQTCQNIFPAQSQLQHLGGFLPQSYSAPVTAGFFRRGLLKLGSRQARRGTCSLASVIPAGTKTLCAFLYFRCGTESRHFVYAA